MLGAVQIKGRLICVNNTLTTCHSTTLVVVFIVEEFPDSDSRYLLISNFHTSGNTSNDQSWRF